MTGELAAMSDSLPAEPTNSMMLTDDDDNQQQQQAQQFSQDSQSSVVFQPEPKRQLFHTPLSTQRYCFVQQFVERNPDIISVTDVGCGNGRMLNWLKTVGHLRHINCIDSSYDILEEQMDSFFRPNLCEMLFGRKSTTEDLHINVFHGDIAVPDSRLMADLFSMVEMIEHITPQHLDEVIRNVFGYYQPRFVLVTTPNVEFNPFLRQLASGQTIDETAAAASTTREFRHYDHKFEFNRLEFSQWAQSICSTYNYEVQFDGVGRMPEVPDLIGPCTQIALFRRVSDQRRCEADFDCLDLMVRKLSVEKGMPECCGDRKLRKVSLKTSFIIPGATQYRTKEEVQPLWEPIPDVDIQIETN